MLGLSYLSNGCVVRDSSVEDVVERSFDLASLVL